jgi:hypothetical protein
LIFDESRQGKVSSTLKATVGSYELRVIEETYNALIRKECRDKGGPKGLNRAREPVANPPQTGISAGFEFPIAPAALAFAFQVIIAADL